MNQTIELRRGLDVLLAQPGVDPRRLAFVGHDYGAMDGLVLATADDRLKAVALMAPDATWASWFFACFSLPRSDEPEYRSAMASFDPVALIARIGPRPLLLQFSGQDEYVSADLARQLTEAAREPKTVRTYDSVGHDLQSDATVTADRDAWLANQLGLR